MSKMEKYRPLFKWIGSISCLVSILILAALFLSPRYNAKITQASDIYYTRRATRSRDRNWQEVKNRLVSVEYEKGTADDVLIKRQRNEKMPDVGDTIIVCSFPQVREYDPARTMTFAAVFAVYGAASMTIGFGWKEKHH